MKFYNTKNYRTAVEESCKKTVKVVNIKYNDAIYKGLNKDIRFKHKVNMCIDKNIPIGRIFVYEREDGAFELLSGIKSLFVLKAKNAEETKVYVMNGITNHKDFVKKYNLKFTNFNNPKDTQEMIYFSDIIIPQVMREHRPRKQKVMDKVAKFKENKGIIKPVVVSKCDDIYMLEDGLISYNYLINHHQEWIPCIVK